MSFVGGRFAPFVGAVALFACQGEETSVVKHDFGQVARIINQSMEIARVAICSS